MLAVDAADDVLVTTVTWMTAATVGGITTAEADAAMPTVAAILLDWSKEDSIAASLVLLPRRETVTCTKVVANILRRPPPGGVPTVIDAPTGKALAMADEILAVFTDVLLLVVSINIVLNGRSVTRILKDDAGTAATVAKIDATEFAEKMVRLMPSSFNTVVTK